MNSFLLPSSQSDFDISGPNSAPSPRPNRCDRPLIAGLALDLLGLMVWIALAAAPSTLLAQAPFERITIVSGDYSELPPQTASLGPEFGYSVAISGPWMAVGAPGTILEASGERTGAVFMFRNQGDSWQLTQRIEFLAGGSFPRCGHSVGLSGSHLVIGCPGATGAGDGLEGGRTLLYRKEASDEWQFQVVYSGSAGQRCGTAVDITSNLLSLTTPVWAVTGCPQHASATGRVVALPYDGNNWGQGTSIAASDGASGDTFGSAVALAVACDFNPPSGFFCRPNLAVGAPSKAHSSAVLGGAVYLFSGGNWTETDRLTHEVPETFGGTLFGTAVDINASQLLVGTPSGYTVNCPTAPRCGRIRRWVRDGSDWTPQISGGAINAGGTPPGEQVGMRFGRAIALGFDNWIAIAAPLTDGGEDAFGNTVDALGAVELRRANDGGWGTNWTDTRAELLPGSFLLPLDYDASQFGSSLAFGDERWLAVGMPQSPGLPFPGTSQGSVWMYGEPDRLFSDRFE